MHGGLRPLVSACFGIHVRRRDLFYFVGVSIMCTKVQKRKISPIMSARLADGQV